jgi:hypothetical protein
MKSTSIVAWQAQHFLDDTTQSGADLEMNEQNIYAEVEVELQ